MKPHTLELQGFTGISSGAGKERIFLDLSKIPEDAQLVALCGPNGAGKSTIMDNLHPYRVMPSRSTTLGPGGFSYWDNISSPTAKKELIWEHAGRRYRSSLNFKISGKTKKADCYLFQWNDALNDWTPVQLDDGTLSDGKSDTYDRCVEGIIGLPESFFTSQFSAQNRKSISQYGASDIKALLASILDLHHYRELAAKAAMVGKLLRFQLENLQDEVSQSRAADAGIENVKQQIAQLESTANTYADLEQAAVEAADLARKEVALLEARRDALAKDAEERIFLDQQIAAAREAARQQLSQEAEKATSLTASLVAEESTAAFDQKSHEDAIKRIDTELGRLHLVLARKDAITEAVAKLPLQHQQILELDQRIEAEQAKLAEARSTQTTLQEQMQKQSELKVSGVAKADVIKQLEQTASLIQQVPCKGSGMQTTCPLLEQANAANNGLPAQTVALQDLRGRYGSVQKTVLELQEKMAAFKSIEAEIEILTRQRKALEQNLQGLSQNAGMGPLLDDAQRRLPQLNEEKETHAKAILACREVVRECATKIASVNKAKEEASQAINQRLSEQLQGLNERLARLQNPVSEAEINLAKTKLQTALGDVDGARAKTQSLGQQKVTLLAKIEAFQAIKVKAEATLAKADCLSAEIAKWKLMEKGMGNDGLIALSIDDAGPEIAMLCNSLLNDCYEGRFAIRLDTQRETQTGNMRETFEVMVFDNHRGDEKSLSCMSGGERVWVNECLTRAIALYVGQANTVQYQTLFSDETDGPLDPDRKRQFMAMKRSVLERGGYEREYFISQTPELWELADFIVDVSTL